MTIQHWGATPVPYTVCWSGEETVFLGHCPHANATALCSPELPGTGKPRFGAPHPVRQRRAIALGLCDLCGKPLKNATKVSLSQARPRANAQRYGDILQVEPLLHRDCAAMCMDHCPSLKDQARGGTLHVRQVFRHAVQFAVYSEQGVFEACGVRQTAIAHAKVQLIAWRDRDAAWLNRRAAA